MLAASSAPTTKARVFFALWPDAACAARLHAIAAACAADRGGRVMQKDTLHLTLAFVGDVDEGELPALCAIAETAGAGPQPTHSLLLDRLGYWPQKRIIWAASAQPPPMLEALAERLADGLRAAGHRLPLRPFAPHVTLLRKAGALPPAPAADALQDAPQPWHFDRFCLLRSRPSASGAAYETLAAWPL